MQQNSAHSFSYSSIRNYINYCVKRVLNRINDGIIIMIIRDCQ